MKIKPLRSKKTLQNIEKYECVNSKCNNWFWRSTITRGSLPLGLRRKGTRTCCKKCGNAAGPEDRKRRAGSNLIKSKKASQNPSKCKRRVSEQ